jgi:hypothetical protein
MTASTSGGRQAVAIETQEHIHAGQRHALVAIGEGVVAGKAITIGGGKRGQVGLGILIVPALPGAGEGGCEQVFLHPCLRATEFRHQLGVDGANGGRR